MKCFTVLTSPFLLSFAVSADGDLASHGFNPHPIVQL